MFILVTMQGYSLIFGLFTEGLSVLTLNLIMDLVFSAVSVALERESCSCELACPSGCHVPAGMDIEVPFQRVNILVM